MGENWEDGTARRKLPVGIQSFEDLRRNAYVYVDKTEYVWQLAQTGKVYFLSRPRRFGKSLFTSTLEAYFRGRRELFTGLSIEKREDARGEDAWIEYPVIHFDLSRGDYSLQDSLSDVLKDTLRKAMAEYGIDGLDGETLPVRFGNLVEAIHSKTGRQVVILVDEYDKPLLDTINDTDLNNRNRQTFKGFFSILKNGDEHLRFSFVTGVTRFTNVSIFSDLNNLNDISMDGKFSALYGITEDELRRDFKPEIAAMAEANGQSAANAWTGLRGSTTGTCSPSEECAYTIRSASSKRSTSSDTAIIGLTRRRRRSSSGICRRQGSGRWT